MLNCEELPMLWESESELKNLDIRHQMTATQTSLSERRISSRYNLVEIEGAIRVMNHAGRILWRAAMEVIQGSAGPYNLPLAVLSKLFQRSCRPISKQKSQAPNFQFPSAKSKVGMQNDNQVDALDQSCEEDGYDDAKGAIQYSTSGLSAGFRNGNVVEPQQNKRKAFFGISSLFAPVVSDSEEDDDDESCRARKRTRRTVETEPVVAYL